MSEKFFSYNELSPKGWIKEQLRVQAEGLAGNLDKIWPDIKDSRWIGGNCEGWERFPYFLDGFVPLAYLLDDEDLKKRADHYIHTIKTSQREDGRICPINDTDEQNSDIWSIFLILKVLVEYDIYTGGADMEDTVFRALKYLEKYICQTSLSNWSAARWYECFIPIIWLYERRPEAWLLSLAHRLQMQGTDYTKAAPVWADGMEYWCREKHVVNIAMALKAEAVTCRLFKTPYTGEAEKMLAILDKQCGTAYGHFNGDECLANNASPIRGSELCGIVETMYSYEHLLAQTQDAAWGDKLEMLAFNGLPATISGDMWVHQYDQQVNQIASLLFEEKHPFSTNNEEANVFGLEPHFGCCTANFGQGWPKFARSAYMRVENGIAVNSPVPMKIETTVNGKAVCLECKSEYPFKNKFTLVYEGDFTLALRIPAWAEFSLDKTAKVENGWAKMELKGNGQVCVEYKTAPILEERQFGSCVKYGPLLFALPIAHEKEIREFVRNGVERKFPYCDYSFRTAGEWAYAFDANTKFVVEEHDFVQPYNKETAPITIRCTLVPIKWGFKAGHKDIADDELKEIERRGENEEKVLIPYGATYLRMTEMPVYKK